MCTLIENQVSADSWVYYCHFVVSFEIVMFESSNIVLFEDYFGSSESLEVPYEFWNQLVTSYSETNWDSDRDYVESVDQFGLFWEGVYVYSAFIFSGFFVEDNVTV